VFLRSVLFLMAAGVPQAATVVSVDGPVAHTASFGTNQILTAGFTPGQDYSNVIISALINGRVAETYTAYLTTAIGPLATVADEVTSVTQNLPGPAALTPIFTGLDLSAGVTYYFTLFNPTGSGGWSSTEAPVTTEAPGSSHELSGYFIIVEPRPPGYPPSADFTDLLEVSDRTFIYTVETAEVPEPGTFALAASALGLLYLVRFVKR